MEVELSLLFINNTIIKVIFMLEILYNFFQLLALDDIKYITQDSVVRQSAVASWGLDRTAQRKLPLNGQADFTGNSIVFNAFKYKHFYHEHIHCKEYTLALSRP